MQKSPKRECHLAVILEIVIEVHPTLDGCGAAAQVSAGHRSVDAP